MLRRSIISTTSAARVSSVGPPVWWLVAVVLLIGLNLRTAIGSVPPLLPEIASDLGLSAAGQGALTSVAIIGMAALAPAGGHVARRLGGERAVAFLLLVLAGAELVRLWADSLPALITSIFTAGCAIGACSTLVPPIIARHLVRHRGIATGAFTAGTALGVALAAGLSVPLSIFTHRWQAGLACWSLLTVITTVIWHTTFRRTGGHSAASARRDVPSARFSYRSVTPWLVTMYAATPMVIGFAIVAWISRFYVDAGPEAAATRLVAFQVPQLLSMLVLPLCAERLRDIRVLLAAPMLLACTGLVLLISAPRLLDPMPSALLGLGIGGSAALGILMITTFSTGFRAATQLSGMVFSIGFAASALGPIFLGALKDWTGSYIPGICALLLLAGIALVSIIPLRPGTRVDTADCEHD